MPTLRTIAERLFTLPGGPSTEYPLLSRASLAHRHLLKCACQENAALRRACPLLSTRLERLGDACDRENLFCHPGLVEGLHRLNSVCPGLKRWHDAVASPSAVDVGCKTCEGFNSLGTVELALRLQGHSPWNGPLCVTTDMLGRLEFPFCDWRITVRTADANCSCVLAEEAIDVSVEGSSLHWQWERDDAPFLTMPLASCQRLIADNATDLEMSGYRCASRRIEPQFHRALPLCGSGASYDRVHIADPVNANKTAVIVDSLHEAFRHNSPSLHREFCAYMSTVRGFELHLKTPGTVQSFSDPTLPGVMGLNIPYNDLHEPLLSPFCFTWLAHEMAHTKFYLINDIAFDHGSTFVRNGAEMTDEVARYARRLPIRTLYQVPYTHFYEWESLMDFMAHDFAGLPWQVDEDPIACGEDLKREIEEAMDLADEIADLTKLGAEAFARFSELFERSNARWITMTAA